MDEDLEESARFTRKTTVSCTSAPTSPDRGRRFEPKAPRPQRARRLHPLQQRLFSIHNEDLPSSACCAIKRARIPAPDRRRQDVLLKLYDADAEYSADVLEGIYDKLEAVSTRVLKSEVTTPKLAKCWPPSPARKT